MVGGLLHIRRERHKAVDRAEIHIPVGSLHGRGEIKLVFRQTVADCEMAHVHRGGINGKQAV